MKELIQATGGELLSGDSNTFSGVSIDSRTIAGGEVFFALRGDNFDGHNFLDSALMKGDGAVVETRLSPLPKGKVIIAVKDTLRALQDFAHFLRMRRDVPVIAVTGSSGKTTTKEMAYAIFSKKWKTLKNAGNLNNHIGLPLTLTKLEDDHEAVVLEMGMNAPGEIRRLCEIAVPTHGVVTNIGSAHIGRLGSYESIRDAKLEILQGLSVAALNADDRFLMEGVDEADFKGEVITFSVTMDSSVKAVDIRKTETGNDFRLVFKDKGDIPVSLKVHGIFNIYNALAAAAVSFSAGLSPEDIKAGLEGFSGYPMRFEIKKINGVTLINDSYNANPASMEESLKELVRLAEGGRKIAVLGDMFELDGFAEEAHRRLGRLISETGIDVFIAVGGMMSLAAEECMKSRVSGFPRMVYCFRDAEDANNNVMDILNAGDVVLVKGSRSMRMEKIAGRIVNAV